MFIFALFCLLAVGSQANPLQPVVEPAQHIVIVTPQAQVHLEPALRYVHGLSPLARVSGPHHEETIVYVPAGAAASVVPTVSETGRAGGRQGEGFPQNINEIQQQAQQGVQVVTGQFGEAAAAAAAAGAGFFPGFFPSQDSSNKQEEKIETPANTQPLLAATEARHFYSLPQVYHTPVVDVVHTPVYSWPISAIRARSIQTEEAPIQQAPKLIAEEKATPELAPVLPEPQPLLKEQRPVEPFEQPAEQPLEQLAQTIIPAAIEASELKELKAEIASRQLEESNAIKDDLPIIEIEKEAIKEVIQETTKEAIKSITEAIKEPIAEARKESSVEAIPEPIVEAIKEPSVEAIKEPIVEAVKQPIVEARKEPSVEARKEASQEEPAIQELAPVLIKEAVKEPSPEPIKEAPKESPIQPEPKLVEEEPSIKAIPIPVEAAIPEPQPQSQPLEAQPAIEPLPKAVEA